jgi:hypothetical protein
MSKKWLLGISFLFGITLAFFVGLYIGGAPLRQYVATTGGAPGLAATDLKNLSDRLVDRHGSTRDDSFIASNLKQMARIRLLLAAQLYCHMPSQYQKIAKQSAMKLQNVMIGADNRTARAMAFLSSSSGSDNNGCFAWAGE